MDAAGTRQFGLIGLGVMGQSLALNIARHGFSLAVHNRTTSVIDEFLRTRAEHAAIVGAPSIEQLVAALERPRRIVLLVKAGAAVDLTIEALLAHVEAGDLIVDAGNSRPADTERRERDLAAQGIRFVGMGVSGGEEGALRGPSLMPGGPREGYALLAPMLEKIAAQVDDGPCVTHVGPGAAGHFVKMVHNGIEYGDMQLIAESYDLLRTVGGMSPGEIGDVFARWNEGPLESYLCEITAAVLGTIDPETGDPMVDVILDKAGQKGTGRWTVEHALELGVPVPTIEAAVAARGLSALKAERVRAAELLPGPEAAAGDAPGLVDAVHDALHASKITSYAQGIALMRAASDLHEWALDFTEIARIWKGGCIIRARLLADIQRAYRRDPSLDNLMLDAGFLGSLREAQPRWRRVVAIAAERGVPALALGASLAYYDSYRRARLPQNLTQAQRDFFGAHTYERVDRPAGEFFHTDWDAGGDATT